jgi:fatty acid desaturase
MTNENPYQSPMADLPQSKAKNFTDRMELASGFLILAGLVLAAARSLWLGDWILCISVAVVIAGLWGGAVVSNRRK